MALKIKNEIQTTNIESDSLVFKILEGGDFYTIEYKYNQISMYKGTNLDGTLANIYMRLEKEGVIYYTKLIGVDSPSSVAIKNNAIIYQGTFEGVNYQVTFQVKNHTWYWKVHLEGIGEVTIYFGQDVSLNGPFANEAYVCQYLDHLALEDEYGYHLITKQNQGERFLLQSGSLTKTIAYATDGFDFFGKDYKFTNVPKAMIENSLPSKIYQYEFAYHTLQTEVLDVSTKQDVVFYSSFVDNYLAMDEQKVDVNSILENYQNLPLVEANNDDFHKLNLAIDFQNTYPYIPLNTRSSFYKTLKPSMVDKEIIDKEVVSWFDENGKHYVDPIKEHYLERPHGIIHISNGFKPIDDKTMTTTNWIFGIFNSHIAYGNTNFNKMLTHNKTPLNILKTSGERLFVKVDGKYQLLALPSLYTMDVASSSWYYQIKKDTLKITTTIAYDKALVQTKIESLLNKKYDFILTDNLMMGPEEFLQPIVYEVNDSKITFKFANGTLPSNHYENYQFGFDTKTDGKFKYGSDEIFYEDKKSRGYPILTVKYQKATEIEIMHTCKMSEEEHFDFEDIDSLEQNYLTNFKQNMNYFHIESLPKTDIARFNHIVKWYTHNALIHYASPHGLEQYGGAAWGTRDVCQGPIELFSSLGHYDIVRDIIKNIYTRQFEDNGDWPQWFMFDKYKNIQAEDSHGDIIVWPLRTVAYYIEQTNDLSILDELVPYTKKHTAEFTEPVSIKDHILKEVASIVDSFVENTHLPCYGGGDWDDTLQPCNRDLTKKMVSGWTVLLLIEALEKFNEVANDEFKELTSKIKKDYKKYLLVDQIPAGFIHFGEKPSVMLHPTDEVTNIKYRLLPFNRGIISEQFDKTKISKYLKIIDQNLMHPDGVRLMNTTVHYDGGIPKIFMRAETATNFGREIGLQYVHAHIRYTEAMAKIGDGKRVYHALNAVCPINIKKHVPNALPRQANVYFSSSDGNFLTRYQADQEFDLLRTGEREVKGGWRLYSSGPGIYLNQFITNFLGIKTYHNALYLDPVMPKTLKGLKVTYQYRGKLLNITYLQEGLIKKVEVNGTLVENTLEKNQYRTCGILIDDNLLQEENNIIIK